MAENEKPVIVTPIVSITYYMYVALECPVPCVN